MQIDLGVAIITGCRETYRKMKGLPTVNCPIYLEQTLDSLSKSDIPQDVITLFIDSLQNSQLSNKFNTVLANSPHKKEINYGGGVTENVIETLKKCSSESYTHILLLEDDILVDKLIYDKSVSFIKRSELMFGSLYNVFNSHEVDYRDFWGGQALLFKRDCLDKFIYGMLNYKEVCPDELVGWPDILLSRIAGRHLNQRVHIYPYSLVQHIGNVSGWSDNNFHTSNTFKG
jgi:hypothetical protein